MAPHYQRGDMHFIYPLLIIDDTFLLLESLLSGNFVPKKNNVYHMFLFCGYTSAVVVDSHS